MQTMKLLKMEFAPFTRGQKGIVFKRSHPDEKFGFVLKGLDYKDHLEGPNPRRPPPKRTYPKRIVNLLLKPLRYNFHKNRNGILVNNVLCGKLLEERPPSAAQSPKKCYNRGH